MWMVAIVTVSGIHCSLEGAVFCSHSYLFWTLLSRQGTFRARISLSLLLYDVEHAANTGVRRLFFQPLFESFVPKWIHVTAP